MEVPTLNMTEQTFNPVFFSVMLLIYVVFSTTLYREGVWLNLRRYAKLAYKYVLKLDSTYFLGQGLTDDLELIRDRSELWN